ncbi:MAG: hypothetical protein PHE53_02315 [Thermoguttaceae bacterium]|nr:hypothetical protein [Thermoguttaceae bacterium]
MKQSLLFPILLSWTLTVGYASEPQSSIPLPNVIATPERMAEERLSFQTHTAWKPRVQLNADVAMVYGIDDSLPERIQTWRERGYRVHLMTGVSWGGYQDYLYGKFDGENHEGEAQMDRQGEPLRHNPNSDVYYMSPGESYGKYLAAGVLRAIDAGVDAVYLEEPEFWVHSGWEPNFRKEWNAFYGDEWLAPDSSPDAQYRASKLKYYLYRRTLAQIFDAVREHAKQTGKQIPCYVPTHSQVNYAQWRIVSPEASLLDVGCDGYIAQVWTGTARSANFYQGREAERTFETAYIEYGAMQNLVRASGRRVWYLNDPIEDNPDHTWADYQKNWECTLTASLLQPEVWRYEIMPWPDRIFYGQYPTALPKELEGNAEAAKQAEKITIPTTYETELQAVISALGDMRQPVSATRWEVSGTQGIGVLFSDTMMFQRGGPGASDAHLGSLYGLALPLIKHGIPLDLVQIENVTESNRFLDRYRILLLTYEGQKPPKPEFHAALADWVRRGGVLVMLDDDSDPFNQVHEWWNMGDFADERAYATPRHHLFEQLGLDAEVTGLQRVGDGYVRYEKRSPAALSRQEDGADQVRRLTAETAQLAGIPWSETHTLALRRGPYLVVATMDESIQNADNQPASQRFPGRWISLFDPQFRIQQDWVSGPGSRALLLDLTAIPADYAGVLVAACRVRSSDLNATEMRFKTDGIEGSVGMLCVACPEKPWEVCVGDTTIPECDTTVFEQEPPIDTSRVVASYCYCEENHLLRIRFLNRADGVQLQVRTQAAAE